jgi:diaminopimelate decarboxylase
MTISNSFRQRLTKVFPRTVEKFGAPFIIYDEIGIRETLQRMNSAFAAHSIDFKEFYAVKALPKPKILDIIHSEGCGFDCSSISELRLARAAGARPEDIIFTSNDTSPEEFAEAVAHGGCILNLDDETFIDKVPGPFPELICFRVNPGSRHPAEDQKDLVDVSSKYGVPIERIPAVCARAKEKGAKRIGIHGMFFSNDLNYRNLVSSVKLLLEIAAQLKDELGIEIEFLDFGGGIGIPYRPEDQEFDMEAFAAECARLLAEFKEKYGFVPKLYAESGRYVTGPHGVLINPVLNLYTKYSEFIGVSVAMPALMRVGIYPKAYHQCVTLDPNGVPRAGEMKNYTVAGPICEGSDVLARNMAMVIARLGDYIETDGCGAHAIAMAFNYNGRTRPLELLICADGTVIVICRAETVEDLERRHQGLEGPEFMLEAA